MGSLLNLLFEEAYDTNKQMLFVIGASGSGKSTIIDYLRLHERFILVNPDHHFEPLLAANGLSQSEYDSKHKEYRRMVNLRKEFYERGEEPPSHDWPEGYRELQSQVRDMDILKLQLFAKARKQSFDDAVRLSEEGKSFLIDGTGGSKNEILSKAKKYKKLEYELGMLFVDVSLQTSIQRNITRGQSGGRRVQLNKLENSWNAIQRNIPIYKDFFGENFWTVNNDGNEEQLISQLNLLQLF